MFIAVLFTIAKYWKQPKCLLTLCKIPVFNWRAIWEQVSSLNYCNTFRNWFPGRTLIPPHPSLFYRQQLSLKNENLFTWRQLQVSDAFSGLFVWHGFNRTCWVLLYLTHLSNLLQISWHTILLTHCAPVTEFFQWALPPLPPSYEGFLYLISFGQKLFLHFISPRIYLSTNSLPSYTIHLSFLCSIITSTENLSKVSKSFAPL